MGFVSNGDGTSEYVYSAGEHRLFIKLLGSWHKWVDRKDGRNPSKLSLLKKLRRCVEMRVDLTDRDLAIMKADIDNEIKLCGKGK